MDIAIPFNKPSAAGNEMKYVQQALESGHISGDGFFTQKCHTLLENMLHVPKVLLTTSCTHALEMMPILLDIQPGDEVIVPSFTFVSSINAFVLRGATPRFLDIKPDTLNINEELIIKSISKRTKIILPVHYGGVGCEMDSILDIASQYGVKVLEDNAHGLFGKYRGKKLGTFGVFAAQSFHETKNISCGEGGAIIINDPAYIERAMIIREKGTNRSRFFKGLVDKYTWVDIGSSYLPSDILAAILLAQLEEHEKIQAHRKRVWDIYFNGLSDWAERHDVQLPYVPEHCEQAFHMFYLVLPSPALRKNLINHLNRHGIISVFHYLPLHLSEMGRKFGGRVGDCPVTEWISDVIIRLPFYNSLSEDEQEFVIQVILDFNFQGN